MRHGFGLPLVRRAALMAVAAMLGACAIVPRPAGEKAPALRPATPPRAATPIAPQPAPAAANAANAARAGAVAGPQIASLPITQAQAARALVAFRLTCPSLVRRVDGSGLTRTEDWRAPCDAARTTADAAARDFFIRWFEAAQIADGKAFATGYFEPEIRASRTRTAGYTAPIYGRPADLVDVDLGLFSDELKGRRVRGRVENNALVPYPDRAAIDAGAIDATAPIIAWAADAAELFFMQIQGSGRLRLPDGSVIRLGYDSQNGRDYTGIGALLRSRGLLAPGQASMQGIVDWLHSHPDEAVGIMQENKSFVFFREQQGPPRGALGQPVTGAVSAAADARFVPLGAPVFLSLNRADATGLWIVQDTGGAIKGANRFDTFWGAGDAARTTAGGMAARGTAFVLLPVGTLARLAAGGARGETPPQR
ncbi:MAG: murein transglycosylase A [Sphingomonas sp.]